jgi:hypothetical protein
MKLRRPTMILRDPRANVIAGAKNESGVTAITHCSALYR